MNFIYVEHFPDPKAFHLTLYHLISTVSLGGRGENGHPFFMDKLRFRGVKRLFQSHMVAKPGLFE